MTDIKSLCKQVSTRLAGVEVVPATETKSFFIEQFLFDVAKAKLQENGNMFAVPGTKSVKFVNSKEQIEKLKGLMVGKWLKYARENSNGTAEAMLETLKYYQER